MPFIPGNSSTVTTSDFILGNDYVIGDRVYDTNIGNVMFVCLNSVTSATLRPSEDPDNWLGQDDPYVGDITLSARTGDSGSSLQILDSVRNISRSKYIRLFRKSCPQVAGCNTTIGSTVLSLPSGVTTVRHGMFVEGSGIQLGTTIGPVTADSTRTATVISGESRLYYRQGAIGTTPSNGTEVTGPHLAANTVVVSSVSDISGTLTTTTGSPNLFGATNNTSYDNTIVNAYIAGSGISADSRVSLVDGSHSLTANTKNISGSNQVYLGCNAGAEVDLNMMLVGRQFTMANLTSTVAGITQPQETLPGTWSWITGVGWMAPYNADVSTTSELIINRKISGGPIGDNASGSITAFNAATTRTASFTSGDTNVFWLNAGNAVAPTNFTNRFVGSADPGIPAESYVTAHTSATTAVQSGTIAGQDGVFLNVGGASPIAGRYATVTGSGYTDVKSTGVRTQFTDSVTRSVNASPILFTTFQEAGALLGTLYRIGQRVTATSFTANSTITAIGNTYSIPSGSVSNAVNSTLLMVPVGDMPINSAEYFANRRIIGGGVASGSYITSSTIESNPGQISLNNGSTTAYPFTGAGALATWGNRYITSATGIASPTRITSVTSLETTRALSESLNGSPRIFLATGGSITGIVVGQKATIGTTIVNANVAALPVAQFTSTSSSTVNANPVIYLQPGIVDASVQNGQIVSGAGIAATARITNKVVEVSEPIVRTTTGTARLNLPVGVTTSGNYNGLRKITGTGIPANANVVSIGTESVTGSLELLDGTTTVKLVPGSGLASTWIDRFISSTAGGLPANTHTSSVTTIDFTAATARSLVGVSKLFFVTGQSLTNITSGSAFTLPTGFPTASRITGTPIAQFTGTGSALVSGSPNLYSQPTVNLANVSAGQRVTQANIAAGTNILTVGTHGIIPKYSVITGSPLLSTIVGGDQSSIGTSRKLVGTGIAANASISSVGSELTFTNIGTFLGSSNLFMTVGSVLTGISQPKYVSISGLPVDTRISSAIVAQATQANTTTVTGSPNIFWPGAGTLSAGAVAGAYITAGGIIDPARISSTVALASNTATSRTTNASATVHLSPNFTNAQVLVGRGISGTGIPANARVTSITAAQATISGCNYTIGATTITCPSSAGATVGAVILGAGIPVGTTISGVGATTISISAPTTAAGSGVSVGSGAVVVISANATATSAGVSLSLTAYVVCDTNSTAGATGTATIGASISVTNAATATTASGTVATLGAQHTMSANSNATSNDITTGTVGAVHVMTANATGNAANATVTYAPWANTTDAASGTQAGGTATFGGVIVISATPLSTTTNDTLTFGRQVTTSANNTATANIVNTLLGPVYTLSANSTATATNVTVTFAPWVLTDTNASGSGVATATFGSIIELSSVATATVSEPFTVGGSITMSAAALSSTSDVQFDLGRSLTMSANATATATGTATFAPWYQFGSNATSTVSGTIGSFGAYTTISDPFTATSSGAVAVEFGANVVPFITTAGTQRNVTGIKVGAIITSATNAAGNNENTTCTFGPVVVMSSNATATGSVTVNVGASTLLDATASASGDDGMYLFGGQTTMSAAATATDENVTLRFFPYGYGDSNGTTGTTFGIPYDVSGQVLMVAGQGIGLTSRSINASVGSESHSLSSAESGMPTHNSVVNDAIVITGGTGIGQVNVAIAAGTGQTISYPATTGTALPGQTAAGRTGSVSGGSVTGTNAASSHNNMQPSKGIGMSLCIYTGAV